jgi:glycosyltransferase involved in cell wall biosynthesis
VTFHLDGQRVPNSVHIIAGLAPEAGGPAYSVPRLATALRPFCGGVTLRSLQTDERVTVRAGKDVSEISPRSRLPLLKQLACSADLRRAIERDASAGALLHTNGLWLMPNIYPAWARHKSGGVCRLVHSPRGMLGAEALKISAWKKRPIWHLWQRKALAAADVIHATALSEYEEVRAAGLSNPVAVIPNGIDLPDLVSFPRKPDGMRGPSRVILSLGRIHPKKGLDRLVQAWAMVADRLPDWSLRILGPAELDHDQALRALAVSIAAKRVEISGPVYDDAKWQTYRHADVFVLPTLNENFAISVAEALACEVPVISTKGAPWAGLVSERCGWWIDHGVEELATTLLEAASMTDHERNAMGGRGRAWMARDFGWDRIGRNMAEVYRWLYAGTAPPSSVRMN